jgi:hypothetical protein
MKILLITILALILHLILGWQWVVVAGIAGGYWQGKGGWRVGLVSITLAWLLLIIWNYLVTSVSIKQMFETMSAIMGGLPSFGFPMLTLVWAALLGVVSGAIGSQIRFSIKPPSRYVSRFR